MPKILKFTDAAAGRRDDKQLFYAFVLYNARQETQRKLEV
jgi:hypothetical protein